MIHVIMGLKGTGKTKQMIEMIREELNFTSLRYHRIDDMIEAIGLPAEKICTYCWSGEE